MTPTSSVPPSGVQEKNRPEPGPPTLQEPGDELEQARWEARVSAAIVDLVTRLQACDQVTTACDLLVDLLHRQFRCHQVAIGLCPPGRKTCRLQSVSDQPLIDHTSDAARAMEAALNEAIVRDALTVYPTTGEAERHGLLAHQQLMPEGSVISSPLRDPSGVVRGAWLFVGDADFAGDSRRRNLLQAMSGPVGSSLEIVRRAERGFLSRMARQTREFMQTRKGLAAVAAVAVAALLLMMPVPHRVKCLCELKPVVRRFLAAPFDGRLEASFVEPGDLVAKNQLLARLDGREIRWELAGATADYNRAAKQRDGRLAAQELGAAKVLAFEMERLQLKMQLLQHRTENLEIVSPIDGIVISGDLKKVEGVPVSVGQTLFEIAPLDRMIVEVGIPEEDVSYVPAGASLTMTLDAYPGREWEGSLERVHPRSEIKETSHVFVGEFTLADSSLPLRPGMQGQARIACGRQPLAWVLFHRPWEKLRLWLGW